jgi:hypothetical protein
MYELKEMPITEQPVAVDASNFITREEFENVINRLKNYLIASTNENTVSAAADAPVATKPEKIERSFEF